MEESIGIISTKRIGLQSIVGIFSSSGYRVWTIARRHGKRKLQREQGSCRAVVFDVEDEEEYRAEMKKRHALMHDIKQMDPRIELMCVVSESICAESCAMGCTKITGKNRSLSQLRSDIDPVLRRVETKVW